LLEQENMSLLSFSSKLLWVKHSERVLKQQDIRVSVTHNKLL